MISIRFFFLKGKKVEHYLAATSVFLIMSKFGTQIHRFQPTQHRERLWH